MNIWKKLRSSLSARDKSQDSLIKPPSATPSQGASDHREKVTFKRPKVFLSYSHSDKEQVADIREYIPSVAFDVFFDRDRLYPGWSWEPALLNMIRDADVFILFVGADTMKRDYVNKELQNFLSSRSEQARVMLIPVLIEGCKEIPPIISNYQALDLRGVNAQSRARRIGQVIHDTFYLPSAEMAHSEKGPDLPPDQSIGAEFQRKWDAGEIGIATIAATQLQNLGIAKSNTPCTHQEFSGEPCSNPVAVTCVGCTKGTCAEPFHLYNRFCTLLPPGNPFSPGTKLFYWCSQCKGPICIYCLGIEDDYPCPPEHVLSYRFRCPVCNGHVQVVPVLEAELVKVSNELLRWSRAGGPPDL